MLKLVDDSLNKKLDEATIIKAIKIIYQNNTRMVLDNFVRRMQNSNFKYSNVSTKISLTAQELNELNTNREVVINLKNRFSSFGIDSKKSNKILTQIRLNNPKVTLNPGQTGNVNLTLSALSNEGITSFQGKRYKFLLGNNSRPLFETSINYNPIAGTSDLPSNRSYDIEEFLQITGLKLSSTADTIGTFFTRPWLETEIKIENTSGIGMKFENLDFDISYGYIPEDGFKYLMLTADSLTAPLYVIKNESSNETFFHKNETTRIFHLGDRYTITAQPYFGSKKFQYWQGPNGERLSNTREYKPRSGERYTIAKASYQ